MRIACTVGDLASIGPEVSTAALLKFLKSHKADQILFFARLDLFSASLKKKLAANIRSGRIRVIENKTPLKKVVAGKPSVATGLQALVDLEAATRACIHGEADVLVTGPIDKYWVSRSLKGFEGHTEFLQDRTRSKGTTMLLDGTKMRVALVTTHLPISKVSKALSVDKIVQTGLRVHRHLSAKGKKPVIAFCGLNPHASDRGLFGDEEARVISPALRKLKKLGVHALGPFSADAIFRDAQRYDAIVAMYHDQGLIALKLQDFYAAVNITLGLPFLRTSVDHGTAFDIAGKGVASSESYERAIRIASRFANDRNSRRSRA